MSAKELRPEFRRRFRAAVRRIWVLHVGRGVARTVAVAALFVAVAAALDYALELPRAARAGLLAVGVAGLAALVARWVVRPAAKWNKTRVAAELEELFPRLGQRVRTADQHGSRPADELLRDGVSPGLVAALEEETAEKVKPLPLQAAMPVRPALVACLLAVACVALLAVPAVRNAEWRTAVGRVALVPSGYTTLTAAASANTVDEGTDVEIRAAVSGRARPGVTLHVRAAGDTEWRQETMDAADGSFSAKLSKLRTTSEFFVAAGPERTPVQQIVVRHALKIAGVRAVVTPPAYTGVPVAVHESGTFTAIQGGTAVLRIELDRSPVSASLVVKDPAKKGEPRRIPLAVAGRQLTAELPLTADIEYAVEARDNDGMPAAANWHRVRVTADQPPQVWFDTPAEGIEVHTLAEIVIRARARDDFGVTKLGVVFQVNNEEERTLILRDATGPHQREAKAEQLLMLEQFLLTQKDCVAYYAFAEDNRPDGPHRTTTELRFIDIRPFLRQYRLADQPDEMNTGPRRELIFLDEVIARQRFNLNRTMRLETRAKVKLDLNEVERVATFQNKLATQTRDLADFLLGLGVDGAAILSQAEEAMLSAVDSLNGAKFGTAVGQERDALRYLMEARNTVLQVLPKQPPKTRAQVRAFDRIQRQKLRRDTEKAESLPQIADELNKLATEEDEVARMIGGPNRSDAAGGKGDPAQDKQDDVAGRAAALEKVAEKAKGLTPLAKARIGEASKAANAAADSLGKGDRAAARPDVEKARETFRAAAKQVAALAAEEAAQQLAAARDLANEVAAQTDPKRDTPGGLGGAAEAAKSVKDVLEKLAGSGAEADADAARKAAGLLKGEDLKAAIDRLEKAGAGDKAERQDLAERFAALGAKLDQAYRETVAPRLEEIARLVREAEELEKKVAGADDSEWRRVRQQAGQFVEKLDGAGLGTLANDDLKAGVRSGDREAMTRGLAAVHGRLIAKIQEFIAGDRVTAGNEAVPPEYRDMVERYLRALSSDGTK